MSILLAPPQVSFEAPLQVCVQKMLGGTGAVDPLGSDLEHRHSIPVSLHPTGEEEEEAHAIRCLVRRSSCLHLYMSPCTFRLIARHPLRSCRRGYYWDNTLHREVSVLSEKCGATHPAN